jgi:hypothetical protein
MARKRRKPRFFLETSIEIQRRFGHALVKRAIDDAIGDDACASSFYVLMEYKRAVVKTLITLWALVKEEPTVGDALKVCAAGFESRAPKFVLMAIAELLNEGDLYNDKDKILRHLEMLIDSSLVAFDRDVAEMIQNRQKCPLARASTEKGYDRFLREIECETKCTVEAFWASQRNELQRLDKEGAADVHQRNDSFKPLYPNIGQALASHTSQKTKRNCMRCGDIIIALEAPADLTLLTFDRSFESLCPILGKKVVRIPSVQALRRAATN